MTLVVLGFVACSGASGGSAGNINMGGTPGAGGATGAASGGNGGAGAGIGFGGEDEATTGTQADPGTEGDGTVPQPAMPGATPYPLPPEALSLLDGAPKGQLLGPMTYTLAGSYKDWTPGWKYRYWIYVPAQYQPGHRAALMVFQDAIHYVQDPLHYAGPKLSDAQFYTATVFDNLIHDGSMPVTIGLFVDPGEPPSAFPYTGSEFPNRSEQYDTPNDQYGKFLTTELIPNVLSGYSLVTDADGWAIAGHSSGGIAAFMTAWFYPNAFHKVLTASPSFSNTMGEFPEQILGVSPPEPIRVYHLAGSHDLCCPSWYDENNQAAMDFMTMGYHYRYRQGQDMHFPPRAAASDFPSALRWLWRGYRTPP
ncbi:MAG TPA: alpha/beta hydrolase-fold protein [Polyangia bacterium]|nr:alpha/beta hydrolase-fold protein [Polyangia bacterium]